MEVTILTHTPELLIGESAKVCYANKQEKDITSTLVHGHGHLAVLRFAFVAINIKGISIPCHVQILRSKHLDFLVESKRYVSLDKGGFKFIMPKGLGILQEKVMANQWETAVNSYKALIAQGVKKEDARAILPTNTSTEMNVAGNLQAWFDFFKLRLTSKAQDEVRGVAELIYSKLSILYPQVFTDKLYKELRNEKEDI